MEPETNQPTSAPQLCRSGCGFYGNSSTDGLCSKCYKDPAVTKQSDNMVPDIMTTTSTGNYDKMQSLSNNETINSDQINEVLNLLSNSSKSSLLLKNHNIDLNSNKMSFHSNDQNPLHQLTKESSTSNENLDEFLNTPESDNMKYDHIVKSQSTSSFLNTSLNLDKFEGEKPETDLMCSENKLSSSNFSIPVSKNASSLETNSNPEELKLDMDTSESLTTSYSLGNSPTLPLHKSKPNRCHFCRKKIGISGFPCRCGGSFCSIHRYSDKHNCTFDYKELAQSEIRKNNPIVQAQKIQKI